MGASTLALLEGRYAFYAHTSSQISKSNPFTAGLMIEHAYTAIASHSMKKKGKHNQQKIRFVYFMVSSQVLRVYCT